MARVRLRRRPTAANRSGIARIPMPWRASACQRADGRRRKSFKRPTRRLTYAISGKQVMSKKQSHTVESSAHRSVQRTRDIRSGIRFDFAERMLRSRENHRLAEIGQCIRKRGARIAHRVGAMQHHERVGIIVMRTQVVNHRLPIVGRCVRRVDKRIKLGEREQACVHVRVLQQAEQPSASVGSRNQAVRRVNHADGAAGICDVNAHCHLL